MCLHEPMEAEWNSCERMLGGWHSSFIMCYYKTHHTLAF